MTNLHMPAMLLLSSIYFTQGIYAQESEVDAALHADVVRLFQENTRLKEDLANTRKDLLEKTTASAQHIEELRKALAETAKYVAAVDARTRNVISDHNGTRMRADGQGRVIHLRNDYRDIHFQD